MPSTSEAETLPSEQPTIRVTAMPADANFYGDIFGGWLVGQMDLAASALASRRSKGRAVLASMERIDFHRPVKVGDEVSIYTRMDDVGRSSMRIAVEAWTRDRNGEEVAKVTSALITFVAIGEDGRPRAVVRG
ncbi:acyl-CoA thioesterase [Sphingobium nicotianae]|uniref:Acyl-CoA thioesterase n=1 Tax=Sphingobium nicotianae TaxID=2782607 RepID=A0A9X1DDV6_9SPHN|nr:acyl-CoA thioesterase [Sphingobium nicotianae]MBT2188168.1 acyl-CoA thioesterase [Sphingobium nicotianae]